MLQITVRHTNQSNLIYHRDKDIKYLNYTQKRFRNTFKNTDQTNNSVCSFDWQHLKQAKKNVHLGITEVVTT